MAWHDIIEKATGRLHAHVSGEAPSVGNEFRVQSHEERKDQTHKWDQTNETWVPRTASRKVTIEALFARMTDIEQAQFYSSVSSGNELAVQLRAAITLNKEVAGGVVSLDSPVTIGMVDILVGLGVIDQLGKERLLA